MITVGVLFGGRTGEHDVSLCSAASVVSALDASRYAVVAIGIDRAGRWYVQDAPEVVPDPEFGRKMRLERTGTWLAANHPDDNRLTLREIGSGQEVRLDVVFPVMHGTYGEDGTLQGLLELAMVPYVGADVIGSAIGMDKDVSKRLLAQAGIPVTPGVTVSRRDWERRKREMVDEAIGRLGLPLFVKPSCAGSSVGVRKAKSEAELCDAVDFAMQFDTKVLVERSVPCREIECAVLGNDEPAASVLGEIVPNHEFYSYEAKYLDPDGARLSIPADVPSALAEEIRSCACRAFTVLCCAGLARVDFFLDRETGAYYLNEINTLPGFTSISMYPKLWEASGLPYAALLDRLIDLAFERHAVRAALKTEC